MPSPNRRTFLAALATGTLVSLTGCASSVDESPPAGSLRFVNNHNLPHSIRIEVTGVGATPGEEPGKVRDDVIAPPMQRHLTASTTVGPEDSETYENIFTEPVWYGVQFLLDGAVPDDNAGTTVFNPADADGGSWEVLTGKIYESGEFSWVISTTDDAGQFDR